MREGQMEDICEQVATLYAKVPKIKAIPPQEKCDLVFHNSPCI